MKVEDDDWEPYEEEFEDFIDYMYESDGFDDLELLESFSRLYDKLGDSYDD